MATSTQSCLRDPTLPCDASASCSATDGSPSRACLASAVPLGVSYSRVRCCFRCCLLGAASELGLDAVRAQWLRETPSHVFGANHGWWVPPPLEEPLYMHASPFAVAPIRALASYLAPQPDRNQSAAVAKAQAEHTYLPGLQIAAEARALRPGLFATFAFASSTRYLELLPSAVPRPATVIFAADGRMSRRWIPSAAGGGMLDANARKRAALGEAPSSTHFFFSNPKATAGDALSHPLPRGLHSGAATWASLLDGREVMGGGTAAVPAFSPAAAAARPTLLLCGCCMDVSYSRRAEKLEALRNNSFRCEAAGDRATVSRHEFIELLLTSRFVFSPAGHGHANHRDWEALVAGAVPVVDYSPDHAELWEGLPVVQVRDWATVTPAFLEAEWRRLAASRDELRMEKVWWPWWLHRFTKGYTRS